MPNGTGTLSDRSAGTDEGATLSYYLGIDLGTTYTAAATWRDGRVEIVSLGSRSAVIPSVVWLHEQGELVTGEAAERRAASDPQRVAREFKRRFGDPTPVFLAGSPYSADALTGRLLRAVVDLVLAREQGPPAGIAISHPANWGDFKQDLLRQAIHQADLDDVGLLTEPEAAAIHYASQSRVDTDSTVAVYDLGGGTFDAAVLRRTNTRWTLLGQPEGIERLGGIDFDQAVFRHVVAAIGDAYDCLQEDDPTALAGVTRLRRDCVDAKEALTSDTDVSVPVLLPTIHTSVRLTRREFEEMIRPALSSSIEALHRALRSAKVTPDAVSSVLLVGGSSRIPLVAQLVGSAFGRPVAVDAHPKHGVALGAAIVAAERAQPHRVITNEVEALDDAVPASVFWAPVKTSAIYPVPESPEFVSAPETVSVPEPGAVPETGAVPANETAPSDPTTVVDAASDPQQGKQPHRREAVSLLVSGLAVLVVAFGGILLLGNRPDTNDPSTPPDVINDGDTPAPEVEQFGRTTTTVGTSTTTTVDPERPAAPMEPVGPPVTTDRPVNTTTPTTTAPTTTTTTEAAPPTTEPPPPTTEPPPPTTLPDQNAAGNLRQVP